MFDMEKVGKFFIKVLWVSWQSLLFLIACIEMSMVIGESLMLLIHLGGFYSFFRCLIKFVFNIFTGVN